MMGEYVPEFRADMLRVEPLILYKMQQGDNEGELDVADPQQVGGQAGKPKRGQANRRERVRTENVNAGFDKLRKLIPTEPENRKLSKIEILRLSTSYIKHLYNLSRANSCLEADEMDAKSALARRGSPIKSMNHVCTFCLMRTKLPNSRRSN